jgi:hypothetical protein
VLIHVQLILDDRPFDPDRPETVPEPPADRSEAAGAMALTWNTDLGWDDFRAMVTGCASGMVDYYLEGDTGGPIKGEIVGGEFDGATVESSDTRLGVATRRR